MEQSKWVIVRRETGFEKFKRSIKSIFFKLFGKDEKCKNIENNKSNKPSRNRITYCLTGSLIGYRSEQW